MTHAPQTILKSEALHNKYRLTSSKGWINKNVLWTIQKNSNLISNYHEGIENWYKFLNTISIHITLHIIYNKDITLNIKCQVAWACRGNCCMVKGRIKVLSHEFWALFILSESQTFFCGRGHVISGLFSCQRWRALSQGDERIRRNSPDVGGVAQGFAIDDRP